MKIVTQFRSALGSLALCAGVNAYAAFFIPDSRTVQIIASFLGVCIMVWLWIMTHTRLKRPLGLINSFAGRIASGDLTATVSYSASDEIGELIKYQQTMIAALNAMLNATNATTNAIVGTVNLLIDQASKTSQGAQNQSTQSQHIASSTQELSNTITGIAQNAETASEASSAAFAAARRGKEVVDVTDKSIRNLFQSVVNLSSLVDRLTKSIAQISDVSADIKGIADQTNLLALNAAIEAARAGEQGRGFAVVADEVRKLADRTIKATEEISKTMVDLKDQSHQTGQSMDSASGDVSTAVGEIKKISGALDEIFSSVQKVQDQSTQISAAVQQQSSAASEVSSNAEQTAAIANDIGQSSQEVFHKINQLLLDVDSMRTVLAQFKTLSSVAQIADRARMDHVLFVDKVHAHIQGDAHLDAAKLPDHHTCRFGKWYDGDGSAACGSLSAFREIAHPHERIHALAKDAVAASQGGDQTRALSLYAEMRNVSEHITEKLEELKRACAK
jgi:methyl-accepting chemotaxis protein